MTPFLKIQKITAHMKNRLENPTENLSIPQYVQSASKIGFQQCIYGDEISFLNEAPITFFGVILKHCS